MVSSVEGIAQDSLYARTIDSLWIHPLRPHLVFKRRAKVAEAKVTYSFYKSTGKMRSIISLSAKENVIFFYLDDKSVMIWPSRGEPYI